MGCERLWGWKISRIGGRERDGTGKPLSGDSKSTMGRRCLAPIEPETIPAQKHICMIYEHLHGLHFFAKLPLKQHERTHTSANARYRSPLKSS